jgi:hypothetical protein
MPASGILSGPIIRVPPRLSLLLQRGSDVGNLDVEADVALVALGPRPHAAAYSGPSLFVSPSRGTTA